MCVPVSDSTRVENEDSLSRGRPSPRRFFVSVRTGLLAILSLFVAGMISFAAANLSSAWTSMSSAQTMRDNNEVGDLFLSAAGSYAAERGVTNAALAGPVPADARVTQRIDRLRKEADAALRAALARVRAGAGFAGKAALLDRVRKDGAALAALREDVDRQLSLPGGQRKPGLSGRWVAAVTALVVSSQELRVAAQVVPSATLARTQILLDLKQATWVMSEFAGRERAMIGGLIGRGAAIDSVALASLAEYRGRLEQSWSMMEAYAARDFASPLVLDAMAAARAGFFDAFDNARRNVLAAGTVGEPYPMAAEEWLEAATGGIDGLLALSAAVGRSAADYTLQVEAQGRNGVFVSVAVLVATALAGLVAFWLVVFRVVRPVRSLTDTMSRLAGGDLAVAIPSSDRRDEIGQMARAVAVFRDAGICNRRLEAEAEESRAAAERERREREAQKAREALELQEAMDALAVGLGKLAEGDVGHRIEAPFAGALDKLRLDFNDSIGKLEQAETLLMDVIDAVPDGIIAFDRQDRLVLLNEAYRRFHAEIADHVEIGMGFEEMMQLAVRRRQFAMPGDTAADEEKWMRARRKAFRKPGKPFTQQLRDGRWLQVQERRSASGTMVGVRTDITSLKRAELTIRDQAEHDPLTGLYNRSVLSGRLARAAQRAHHGGYSGALVIADLDDFKAVNDTFGHDAGDRLLKEIARRLRGSLRANDVLMRLGGDEFAFILPKIGGEASLERLLDRVAAAIRQPAAIGGQQVVPASSLGVAVFPRDGMSPGGLMKNADIALYESKSDNRGGYRIFQKRMRAAIEKRQKLAAALRTDLAARRLGIALQPQIRLSDGAHAGFEVLARWSRNGEAVPPPEFIPLAEETGMIVALGEQVLEAAVSAIRSLRSSGLETGGVAVNVAAAQLKLDSFAGHVEALLRRHGVPPGLLEIEITENVLLDRDPDRILASLEAVKRLGVKVALDDFGTGFASLTHLKRFPVDRLKIDRSFVNSIETDAEDAAISRTIISLAHSLGLEVVAEGVETPEQLAFLRRHGCDYGQGFLFGKPEPASTLPGYLERARAGSPAFLHAAE